MVPFFVEVLALVSLMSRDYGGIMKNGGRPNWPAPKSISFFETIFQEMYDSEIEVKKELTGIIGIRIKLDLALRFSTGIGHRDRSLVHTPDQQIIITNGQILDLDPKVLTAVIAHPKPGFTFRLGDDPIVQQRNL
jgi:hypothetical protein